MSEKIKVPEGWESVELGEILKIETGSKNAEDSLLDGNYSFFTRAEETQKIDTYSYDTEALFIAGEGNFRVKYYKGKFEAHQRTYILTSKNKNIDLLYLQKAIQPKITKLISTSVGSTVMSLRKPQIAEIDILTPKKKQEQQKIAEVLSEVDSAISKTKELLSKNERLKTALMQDLLSYGIDENGKVRNPKTHKFKSSLLGDIPNEWELKLFTEIYSFKTTNSLSRDELTYDNGLVKNIHYGDIHTKFSILFNIENETIPYINSSFSLDRVNSENYCLEGDIIFADASEDINDVGKSIEIVYVNGKKLLSGLHTLLARQKVQKLIVGFSGYLFMSNRIRNQIKMEAQGAKVFGISKTSFSNIKIAFPTNPKEQKKIAQILSSQDEKIEDIKTKLTKLKSLKIALMQDLLSGKKRVTKLMESK